jgi:TorA maturation chaperone TorD
VSHVPYPGCLYVAGDETLEPVMKNMDAPVWFSSHENIRIDSYVMLASLLAQPPSEDLLDILQDLRWEEVVPEKLDSALKVLRQASRNCSLAAIEAEFSKLFVGLGCGKMVPYASWYKERIIQSSTLASVRSDLICLGIVRQEDCHESEDHAGVLCEIMALISQKSNDVPYATQAKFFQQHISSWMTTFFKDLQSEKDIQFYRTVGIFGSLFLEYEREYLKYGADL